MRIGADFVNKTCIVPQHKGRIPQPIASSQTTMRDVICTASQGLKKIARFSPLF